MDECRRLMIYLAVIPGGYDVGDPIKPDLDPEGYDRLIDFMESARYRMLQQQFVRENVEHLMVRMGFRMHSPDAYNEIQEQMSFLRRLWTMKPSLEDRVQTLETRLEATEKIQAARFAQIIESLNDKHMSNIKVQQDSTTERHAIRADVISITKDVQRTKVASLLQLVLLLVAALGALVIRYVLP